jgi:hypothetical protein
MKLKLSIILISFIILNACTRNNNTNNTCTLNASSFSGAYKITSEKVQADSTSPAVENIQNWEECEVDNIYDFSNSGSFSINEGLVSCTNPPITTVGTWNLSGDTLALSYTPGSNVDILISNFNCTSFKTVDVDSLSGEIRTTTFQKQ